MKCDTCDHKPIDCLSCETQIFNGNDNDITLLDEWARVARMRDNQDLSDTLTMCADFIVGLTYCRTPYAMDIMAETLGSLRDDARVRSIRERFRVARLAALAALETSENKC